MHLIQQQQKKKQKLITLIHWHSSRDELWCWVPPFQYNLPSTSLTNEKSMFVSIYWILFHQILARHTKNVRLSILHWNGKESQWSRKLIDRPYRNKEMHTHTNTRTKSQFSNSAWCLKVKRYRKTVNNVILIQTTQNPSATIKVNLRNLVLSLNYQHREVKLIKTSIFSNMEQIILRIYRFIKKCTRWKNPPHILNNMIYHFLYQAELSYTQNPAINFQLT